MDNAGNEVDLVSGIIHLLSGWDLASFPALSIYSQVGISRSASETDVNLVSGIVCLPSGWDFSVCIGDQCLINFLTYDIKNYQISFVISFIYDILSHITTF